MKKWEKFVFLLLVFIDVLAIIFILSVTRASAQTETPGPTFTPTPEKTYITGGPTLTPVLSGDCHPSLMGADMSDYSAEFVYNCLRCFPEAPTATLEPTLTATLLPMPTCDPSQQTCLPTPTPTITTTTPTPGPTPTLGTLLVECYDDPDNNCIQYDEQTVYWLQEISVDVDGGDISWAKVPQFAEYGGMVYMHLYTDMQFIWDEEPSTQACQYNGGDSPGTMQFTQRSMNKYVRGEWDVSLGELTPEIDHNLHHVFEWQSGSPYWWRMNVEVNYDFEWCVHYQIEGYFISVISVDPEFDPSVLVPDQPTPTPTITATPYNDGMCMYPGLYGAEDEEGLEIYQRTGPCFTVVPEFSALQSFAIGLGLIDEGWQGVKVCLLYTGVENLSIMGVPINIMEFFLAGGVFGIIRYLRRKSD